MKNTFFLIGIFLCLNFISKSQTMSASCADDHRHIENNDTHQCSTNVLSAIKTATYQEAKTLNSNTNILIDPDIQYQTVEGWGVSMAWWANLAGGWSNATQDSIVKYAVEDLNLNVFRFNIGGGENPNCTSGDHFRKDGGKMPGYRDQQANGQGHGTYDFDNDSRQITMMDKIATLRASKGDIITETFSNSPPWWMTYGQCASGNTSNTAENLKTEFYDDFADYLVSITKGLKDTYPSWNIKYIEPFNEPMSGYWKKGGGQEGSAFYPAAQETLLWRLWQKQQEYGLNDVSFTIADNTGIDKAIQNITTLEANSSNEYYYNAKINTHSYWGSAQDKIDLANLVQEKGNKPIWQSETGPLGWNNPTGGPWWVRDYIIAQRLVEDMRTLKSVVWCDWQLISKDDGWGALQMINWDEDNPYQEPELSIRRSFYCRKNVTAFIKQGYKIIESQNENTLAALSPDESELVIVAVNKTDSALDFNFDLSKFSNVEFQTYRTSGGHSSSENTSEKTISSVSEKGVLNGDILAYEAPAYSVTTFKIDLCVEVEIAAWLEGAYDTTTGEMTNHLSTSRGLLPGQTPTNNIITPTPAGQPYSVAPWYYAGTEGTNWTDADYTGDETDWVLVSFRTGVQKNTEVGRIAGLLNKDGSIQFPNRCPLISPPSSSLYVVVEHRNHMSVMTPQAVNLLGNKLTYDFRMSDSYRDPTSFGQKQTSTGEWLMYAGDANQFDSPSSDIQGADKIIWTENNGFFDYYLSPDFNLDGDTNGEDKSLWFENNGISSRVPK